jgi:hypothetical protein
MRIFLVDVNLQKENVFVNDYSHKNCKNTIGNLQH